MSTPFSHGPVSKVAFRTPIAALYKTSTDEHVIKIFFQDILGGIRLISYDDAWNGGTASFTTAKLGTPLAAIASPALDKVILYFLSPDNKLRELCYDAGQSSGWFEGALSAKNVEVAPYSQIAAVYLPNSAIRVFVQQPNDTIQEFSIDEGSDWYTGTNFGDALSGTSIAATCYAGTRNILVFFQKTDLTIWGTGTSGGGWFDLDMGLVKQPARGALVIVAYINPVNNSDFSNRLYYTAADNTIKEKIYNAVSFSGWTDGTFNVKTIPGSNIDVLVWTNGNDNHFRAFLQQGEQVTALSEWAAIGTAEWGQGYLSLPPATL